MLHRRLKILYGAGNRLGATVQLKRFLKNIKFDIKIIAHIDFCSNLRYTHWVAEGLFMHNNKRQFKYLKELFGHRIPYNWNLKKAEHLLFEIANWKPDLVITDGEPIVAHVAQTLNIPLWSCSTLHLLSSVKWNRDDLKYKVYLAKDKLLIDNLSQMANKKLIYSPFNNFIKFNTKEQISFITPYWKKPKNSLISGTTNDLADCLYNKIYPIIKPDFNDSENLINASICDKFDLGFNVGSIDIIDSNILADYNPQVIKPINGETKFLHEYIEDEL